MMATEPDALRANAAENVVVGSLGRFAASHGVGEALTVNFRGLRDYLRALDAVKYAEFIYQVAERFKGFNPQTIRDYLEAGVTLYDLVRQFFGDAEAVRVFAMSGVTAADLTHYLAHSKMIPSIAVVRANKLHDNQTAERHAMMASREGAQPQTAECETNQASDDAPKDSPTGQDGGAAEGEQPATAGADTPPDAGHAGSEAENNPSEQSAGSSDAVPSSSETTAADAPAGDAQGEDKPSASA